MTDRLEVTPELRIVADKLQRLAQIEREHPRLDDEIASKEQALKDHVEQGKLTPWDRITWPSWVKWTICPITALVAFSDDYSFRMERVQLCIELEDLQKLKGERDLLSRVFAPLLRN